MLLLIEQEAIDIDWFFLDNQENICHVASAGGYIPNQIANFEREVTILSNYFQSYPFNTDISLCESNIKKRFGYNITDLEHPYLQDFAKMARRGIFSFDKLVLNNFEDDRYTMLARPNISLKVNHLPIEVQKILFENKIGETIDECKNIVIKTLFNE